MTRLDSKPALLIIDMQNGFCDPQGSFAKIGMPTERQFSVIPKIKELRRPCREAGIPVVYTATTFNADYSDAGLAEQELEGLKENKGFVRGTWDSQVVDQLRPGEDEIVVPKTRNNGFWNSTLDQVLTSKGVNQILPQALQPTSVSNPPSERRELTGTGRSRSQMAQQR